MATASVAPGPAPAADVEAIVEQFAPQAQAKNLTVNVRNDVLTAVETSTIIAPTYHDSTTYCEKPVSTTAVKVAGGITTGLGTAAKVDPEPISKTILGIATFVSGLVGSIFGSHAKKAAAEQATTCSDIPQLNALIAQTDSDFQAGKLTKAQAIAQLQAGLAGFEGSFTAGVKVKDNFSGYQVNRPGDVDLQMQAIIAYRDQVKYNVFEIPFAWRIGIIALLFFGGIFWMVKRQ